jgi:hypothetical protein
MESRKMVIFGTSTDEVGNQWQIGIPLEDLTTHAFMIGTTGSGKSTSLKNLAIQTFALGASTAILEPHGDLCLDILGAVPNNALSKLIYLSIDSNQPPSIPLMTFGLGGGIDVGVDAVMGVLRMAEPSAWEQATQMREVLRHTIRVILDAQGWNASIIALDRFLTPGQDTFREAILSQTSEENFKSRDYCETNIIPALANDKGFSSLLNSIKAGQRRMEIFVNDRRLRRTLAVPPLGPRIDLREMLTGGRMVLVPVNKAEIGSRAAPLVSMLFMQMVQSAFLGRVDRSNRQQAVIIIDEFAAMAGGKNNGKVVAQITETLLAEARKFGASLFLATQSAAQLPPDVRTEIQINTNHKIILLVSDPDEAKAAIGILGSDMVNDVDIRNMPRFHGYVKAMVDKEPMPPALLKMLPPRKLAPLPGVSEIFPDPERPETGEAWARVRQLAHSISNSDDIHGAQQVVAFLRELDPDTWDQVISDAQAWNQYQAARLLADPSLKPDKVERAKTISRCLYGLPWWLREAHYWRVLRGVKRQGRPKERTQTKVDAGWN